MPYKNKVAGGSTFEMAERRRKTMIIIAVVGVVIFAILLVAINSSKTLGIGGIGFFVLLFGVKVFPDILDGILGKKQKEVKRAIRGAKAEVQIDTLLSALSEDYYVINDLESPFGNIDHVVFSKNGAFFLIETKSHHGKVSFQDCAIYINGHSPEKDFILQTLKNTYWCREKINEITGTKVWIHPVIVFTNALVPYSDPIKGVHILNQRFLIRTITNINDRCRTNNSLWENKDRILTALS